MGRFLSRSQQWRLTFWIQKQNRPLWSHSTTRFRQCSAEIADSETLKMKETKKREKERNKKHEMVKKLARDVEILTCRSNYAGDGVCDVYLVGANHWSEKSSKHVQELIRFLKPQVVFLELCQNRRSILTTKTVPKMPTYEEIFSEIDKTDNVIEKALKLLKLWQLETCRIVDIMPGSDFRVAYEEALKYGGKVVLGDRPQQITMLRAQRRMTRWEKIRLNFSISLSIISCTLKVTSERAKNLRNNLDTPPHLQNKKKKFPSLVETLVNERDQYMSFGLLTVASKSSSVVAVVGKGHLQGMKKYWMQPIERKDFENLETIPPPKAGISRLIMLAGVVTISGIYLSLKT